MTGSLLQSLKRIGIDEALVSQVTDPVNSDHNTSKKDVLVLQEAILQVQTKCDERYYQFRTESDHKYHELKTELVKRLAHVRIEFHSMHRHSIYAFSAILVSILRVLAVNIYFHL